MDRTRVFIMLLPVVPPTLSPLTKTGFIAKLRTW